MNGSTDIPTIQANIEWYLKKNYHDKIDAMKWESLEDGTTRLALFRGGAVPRLYGKSEKGGVSSVAPLPS